VASLEPELDDVEDDDDEDPQPASKTSESATQQDRAAFQA